MLLLSVSLYATAYRWLGCWRTPLATEAPMTSTLTPLPLLRLGGIFALSHDFAKLTPQGGAIDLARAVPLTFKVQSQITHPRVLTHSGQLKGAFQSGFQMVHARHRTGQGPD